MSIIFTLAAIGILSLFCQWISWWIKLPAILLLLLSGIVVGPVLGWLQPSQLFGHLYSPLISLSVAVILFEGSLTLNFDEIQGQTRVVRNLLTIGVLTTAILTTVFAHFTIGMSWGLSALLGAIVSVTGPTVIVPMLRTVRPNSTIANLLRWEGILIDPIGAILAILVFGFIATSHGNATLGFTLFHFTEQIIIGFIYGIIFGYGLGVAIRRHWLPEFLHNIAALTVVLAVFSISNWVDEGSGLLAVTVMGILLANMDDVPVQEILGFKESLSILLISGLFILLAANVQITHAHKHLILATLILFLDIQFIIRPISIALCTWGSSLTWQERVMLAWIAPRGIVAAAVSALFAYRLGKLGYKHAELLVLITFIIIICTVVFQSITARFIARWLGVAEPEPKGFLIIGANAVARAIADTLKQHGFSVLLSGRNWDLIKMARMQGLSAYYGNPISEHADRHLDLVGIGRMLAITPQEDLNTLACLRYRPEFGSKNIYAIYTQHTPKESVEDKHTAADRHRGNDLFDAKVTYKDLDEWIKQGASIRSTAITDTFDYLAYLDQHGDNAIPMFTISARGQLRIVTDPNKVDVNAGDTIISLIKNN